MSSYEWKKNCAIVDRCYYFEYTVLGTVSFLGLLAFKDFYYIYKNHYADRAKKRLSKYLVSFFVINGISYWFNLYPLTKEEKRQQWIKFRHIGKLLYGLTYLDLEEDRKLRLEKAKLKKEGEGEGVKDSLEKPKAAAAHH